MTISTGQRPAHIAMFSIAASGHIHPSLDVIRELVDRGHRVTYAIPESFAELVASTGAEPRIYDSSLPTDADPDNWGAEPIDHMELFLDNAVHSLPSIAAQYEDDVPDLVLFDSLTYAGRVLGHRLNVPTVQMCPHMVPWEGYEEEMLAPVMGPLMESPRGRAYAERFTGWLRENGMTESPVRFITHPGRRIALIPRAMQPNADRVDTTLNTFTGSCQGDRADQGDWERPKDAEKVLLVSLGSVFTKRPDFYRACLAAFGDLPGWHVVLQIGKHVDVAELGPIPANVEVSSWVPQVAILRQADAFVTHAGMGGSKEGLAAGVPMVAVPQAADQFVNADVLQGLGVARHLPAEEATAEALREAVLSLVADPAVAARSAALKAELAAEGGTPYAADLIEAELRPTR
ncbi:macrolide family glycosyltransferase [Streptomyces triculaminicus]|uniref:macrolide family glycosyltransferase n=1 Tax=Streptomyces triculaminicus TaxID=2816232 RepID=UPI0037CCECDD